MDCRGINNTTIVAVATAPGEGGLAVIRVSGQDAISISDKVWKGKHLADIPVRTATLGYITGEDNEIIDQALATVFRASASFTGEDVVEFSCHGSRWIQREVVNQLIRNGARPAGHGEFSQRAFLNGRIDLAQAEAIADLISASSKAAHRLAMTQMKGEFSIRLNDLRNRLIDIASLLELELDFSEEDVEFANREQLISLADSVISMIDKLADSYSAGAAFREGIPVVIAGRPNAGKSTLLNSLLGEEKAIVTDIPGTTRDVIDDTVELDGILFRVYDTAGLRDTEDKVEKIGIDRAMDCLSKASIILWLIDPTYDSHNPANNKADMIAIRSQIEEALSYKLQPNQTMLLLMNKTDLHAISEEIIGLDTDIMEISGKSGKGIEQLVSAIVTTAKRDYNPDQEIIVTNARHYEALIRGKESLIRAREGIESGLSADFISQDIREATHYLGEITGTVTTDTLLQTIFSRFCIGK